MSEPIKATCEKCGGKVFLVKMETGDMVPIVNPRLTVVVHAQSGWVKGPEGYAVHACPAKK